MAKQPLMHLLGRCFTTMGWAWPRGTSSTPLVHGIQNAQDGQQCLSTRAARQAWATVHTQIVSCEWALFMHDTAPSSTTLSDWLKPAFTVCNGILSSGSVQSAIVYWAQVAYSLWWYTERISLSSPTYQHYSLAVALLLSQSRFVHTTI